MAINHQEYLETLLGGVGDILSCTVTHIKEWARAYTPVEKLLLSSDGFDNKKLYGYYPYEQTLKEAKQLLTEAGYPNGFKTELVFTPGALAYDVYEEDQAQTLKEYWAKIGIELILDPQISAVRTTMRERKTHKEMLRQSQSSNFPQHMYTTRAGNIYNLAIVNDPKTEELYQQISVMKPYSDEWWNKLSEINLYDIDRVYYVTIPSGYEWAFWQPWLMGYYG